MAKGGRNQSGLLGRRSPPLRPSTAAHKWVLLLQVRNFFPGSESRPPRPRGESSCRRRDAWLLALHLTRRPQSRPEQPVSFQPLLLSRLLRLVLLWDGKWGRGKAATGSEDLVAPLTRELLASV